ncbi:MAG: biotin/lipoyl-binding protein [Aliarcobacter skirrowii]|nr:biotin/lipoyl-binding protein [Aliarcobacter skirrowii]
MANGNYTVVVDGQRFNVSVFEGDVQNIQVAAPVQQVVQAPINQEPVQTTAPKVNYSGTEATAPVNGNVWKILVKEGDRVEKDQQIMILEAMKMEIDVVAPVSGTVSKILTEANKAVEEGAVLAIIS